MQFFKFEIHIHDSYSEASLSQIFYLGPSLYFMQSRKESFKNNKKLPDFGHKIKSNAYIKKLRHRKFQIVNVYIK